MVLDSAAAGLISGIPNLFQMKKIVDVAEVNQQHCLEESGQWLCNVDQTHLLLASGKLVLNKEIVLFN